MNRYARSWCIVAICAVLSLLAGCFAGSTGEPPAGSHPADVLPSDTYLEQYADNWAYQRLNKTLQDCYGTLYTALTDSMFTDAVIDSEDGTTYGIAVTLPHPLSSREDGQTLYRAVLNDNPHFFYVSNAYTLEGYKQDDVSYYNTIKLTFTADATQRRTAYEAMNKAVDTLMATAPRTDDQFQIELYLHDQLAERCTYDDEAAASKDGTHHYAYTAYGALAQGKAVCEGYSRAMQLLLKKFNIPCTLVSGTSLENGENHMWNLVTINGKSYYLDATWNDSGDLGRHSYFNITTQQLLRTHSIDADQKWVVNCSSIDDYYYNRLGTYIHSNDRYAIANVIAQQVRRGATDIELVFAPDAFENARLFLKNATITKQAVNSYLSGSEYTMWSYRLYSEAKTYTLTLRKK